MTIGLVTQYTQLYTPLLTGPPPLTEEESIRWLVDEAFKAGKRMIRTHLRDDITRFIILAQCLETHGYNMQWIKRKGCVGASRKDIYDIKGSSRTSITPLQAS